MIILPFSPKSPLATPSVSIVSILPLLPLSTFPALQIQSLKLKITQCLRASRSHPMKWHGSLRKVIGYEKFSEFFPATFIGNH
jgi:hypothetical protein